MAQGEFTKQEAKAIKAEVVEMFDAIPKSKRYDYIGQFNDAMLFLEAAGRAAPDESATD